MGSQPLFSLKGKVALVTGAQQGMGAAHAEILAKQGANVVVTDITLEGPQKVADKITANGGEALALALDVTDRVSVDAAFTNAVDHFGRVDILVNNAGIYQPKPALDLTDADFDNTIAVNLKGQFLCAQRAAQEMKKNGWGRIINIASVASGQVGVGVMNSAHYTASKGGVVGMTETLAIEFAPLGITVNAIAPGAINTPMAPEDKMPDEQKQGVYGRIAMHRFGKPEEVAAAAAFLASEEASYITGAMLVVDGGWLAM